MFRSSFALDRPPPEAQKWSFFDPPARPPFFVNFLNFFREKKFVSRINSFCSSKIVDNSYFAVTLHTQIRCEKSTPWITIFVLKFYRKKMHKIYRSRSLFTTLSTTTSSITQKISSPSDPFTPQKTFFSFPSQSYCLELLTSRSYTAPRRWDVPPLSLLWKAPAQTPLASRSNLCCSWCNQLCLHCNLPKRRDTSYDSDLYFRSSFLASINVPLRSFLLRTPLLDRLIRIILCIIVARFAHDFPDRTIRTTPTWDHVDVSYKTTSSIV